MKSEKKEKIYKAALSMIKKTGVHGLAMGQLSKDSGIAAGTFYHYFSSKDMMLQETFLYCHKRAAAVGAKAVKKDGTYHDRFMDLMLAWYEHFHKHTVEMYFMQESEAGFSVTNNAIRESRIFYNDVFHFFNQGAEKGEIRSMDPKLMLQVVFQSIFSIIKYEIIFETTHPKEETESLLQICWEALKKRNVSARQPE